jgi:hypothetical protein
MHQSPVKLMGRRRDRQDEIDDLEEAVERRSLRAALPKGRKLPLREDSPRAQARGGREPPYR